MTLTTPRRVDWRRSAAATDYDPDDVELAQTPPDVVEGLGFDPKEESNEAETPIHSRIAASLASLRARGDYTEFPRLQAFLATGNGSEAAVNEVRGLQGLDYIKDLMTGVNGNVILTDGVIDDFQPKD